MHLARVLTVALALAISAGTAEAQRRCVKGIPCGNTCIAANKTCRISGGSATGSSRTVQQAVTPPADAQFVASSRGKVYYWVGCNGWKGLAPVNLRFFKTAAGYRPSTQAGCAGPAELTVAQPAREPEARVNEMLACVGFRVRFGRHQRWSSGGTWSGRSRENARGIGGGPVHRRRCPHTSSCWCGHSSMRRIASTA